MKGENQDVLWHRYCYSDFTSEGHIKRALKKNESESKPDEEDTPANEPSKRSSIQRINWSKCIFHATQVAAFRRKEEGEPAVDIELSPKLERRLDLQVPSELHELIDLSLDNKKPEPELQKTVSSEWYTPDSSLIDESYIKDLAWILGRLHEQQPELQSRPGWIGFNQLLSTEKPQVTVVSSRPIVNALAHEFETLWTVILRCKAMMHLRNGKFTVITTDEGLYNKAKMLQWGKTQVLKDAIIVLGGFHTQMTSSKVIAKYLESSGMAEMWALFGTPRVALSRDMDVCEYIKTKALHTSSQNPALRGEEEVASGISCQFYGVGKASAWKVFEDVPDLLEHLGEESQISADVLAKAEAFVCKLYNPGTQEVEINKERASMLCKSKKDLDALPPTQDALILHIKQANYQTMVWNKALEPCPALPKPEDSRWYYSEGLQKPKLMNREQVSAACLQLAYCGCSREGGCCGNRRCTCARLSLCCSKACKCGDRNDRNTAEEANEA